MAAEELSYKVVYVSGDDDKDAQDDGRADPSLLKTRGWTSNKYVSFQNNKDDKSRELKTIYVDASGWYLRLLVHENYRNPKINKYDQVGIMKITPFGFYLSKDSESESESDQQIKEEKKEKETFTRNAEPKKSSIKLDTFPQHDEKNYSTEMREIQKIFERKKRDAVANEQFALAKRLKYGTDTLRKAIEEIDRLSQDKREAVEEEDFDRAIQCKDQIEAVRASTYSDIKLFQLLTDSEKQTLGLKARDLEVREKPRYSRSASNSRNSEKRRLGSSSSKSQNPYTKRENTVLPAIERRRNSLPNSYDRNSSEDRLPPISSPDTDSIEDGILSSVPDKDRSEVSQAIHVFGIEPVDRELL